MKSLIDDLKVLLDHPPYMMGAYEYYALELQQDDHLAEQMARNVMLQWIKDVEAVLELAETELELQKWREVTQGPISLGVTDEERLKSILNRIIVRFESDAPSKSHIDMPESVREDFEEARDVFPYSARSSAALLRLALQKLCIELGEKGKRIDDDIKNLVAKGVPEHIQQSLDIVRIIGNESVHPGVIDVRDNPEIALELFDFINGIIEELIARPKRIQSRYDKLPDSKQDYIKKRDGKNASTDNVNKI